MTNSTNDWQVAVAIALQDVENRWGSQLAKKLEEIVQINEGRGRLNWYLDQSPKHTPEQYVAKIEHDYLQDHVYIESLQIHKHIHQWADLQQKLQQRAYRLLNRWNYSQEDCMRTAADIAQDACLEILHAHYPYDCEFDSWAAILVLNLSRKHARHLRVQQDAQTLFAMVKQDAESLPNPARSFEIEQHASRRDIADALQQLSSNLQIVILEYYFLGSSFPQIAKMHHLSVNAVYKRHHDALKLLRKILGGDGY